MNKVKISISLKKRKYFIYFLCTFFILFLFSKNTFSASITFSTNFEMDFDEIVTGTVTSAFTLSTNGILTRISGDGVAIGGEQEGNVKINGDTGEMVNFTITAVSDLTGPGSTIPISFYTTNSPISTNTNALIGATITLGPNQTAGDYTGSYTIKAEYQTDLGTFYTSASQNVFLKVIAQAVVTESVQLDFGTFLPDLAGGTIVLNQAGNISNSIGTATFFGGHQLGSFNIVGEKSTIVNINFSSGDVLTGAGANISLNNLSTQQSSINLDASGSKDIDVFGNITYSTGQAPGIYQGNYMVYVNY